jgi:hypothetical protein
VASDLLISQYVVACWNVAWSVVLPVEKGGRLGKIEFAALVRVDLNDLALVARAGVFVENLAAAWISEDNRYGINIVCSNGIELLGELTIVFSNLF